MDKSEFDKYMEQAKSLPIDAQRVYIRNFDKQVIFDELYSVMEWADAFRKRANKLVDMFSDEHFKEALYSDFETDIVTEMTEKAEQAKAEKEKATKQTNGQPVAKEVKTA